MSDPLKPIDQPSFWRGRINEAFAKGWELHKAIYQIDPDTWGRIQEGLQSLLLRFVKPGNRLLDAGCGYGALLEVMPEDTSYVGVDISPDLLEIGRFRYPMAEFVLGDLKCLPFDDGAFDWAVCRSIKDMVEENLGGEEWLAMEKELLRVADNLLLVEYGDPIGYIIKPEIRRDRDA